MRAGAKPVRPGRYAAIDLGTVTCRMLVADVSADGELHEVRREYAIVNLGEGVDSSRRLIPAAIERAAQTIGRYKALLDDMASCEGGVPIRVTAIATSAARDAVNSDELCAALGKAGVSLRVIPGTLEAALSFAGASVDFAGEDLLVVDVGGGSTEVIAGRAQGLPARSHSFDVGCRRITERFLASDPPRAEELARAEAWVAEQMAPYFASLVEEGLRWQRVVAVAGTATTVVSIHENMQRYDSSVVHKYEVGLDVLEGQLAHLAALPLSERKEVVGLDPGRAPVIVAGLAILRQVLGLAGASSFTASETDILQGVVMAAARGEMP